MAPRKTAAKGKGSVAVGTKAKAPVVVMSNAIDADNILAKPVSKASKTGTRKPRSSFDRNIQKLLETQNEVASPVAGSSAMAAGSSKLAEEAGEETARQLRRLDKILKEVTQLRQQVLSTADQTVMFGTVQNIDVVADGIVDTVNGIQETVLELDGTVTDINETTADIKETTTEIKDTVTEVNDNVTEMKETVTEVNDTVDGISCTVTDTQDAITTLQYTVDTTAANIEVLQEEIVELSRGDIVYYQALRDRMDAMDLKLDRLIEVVRDSY